MVDVYVSSGLLLDWLELRPTLTLALLQVPIRLFRILFVLKLFCNFVDLVLPVSIIPCLERLLLTSDSDIPAVIQCLLLFIQGHLLLVFALNTSQLDLSVEALDRTYDQGSLAEGN